MFKGAMILVKLEAFPQGMVHLDLFEVHHGKENEDEIKARVAKDLANPSSRYSESPGLRRPPRISIATPQGMPPELAQMLQTIVQQASGTIDQIPKRWELWISEEEYKQMGSPKLYDIIEGHFKRAKEEKKE
jgi:hypothetical protein